MLSKYFSAKFIIEKLNNLKFGGCFLGDFSFQISFFAAVKTRLNSFRDKTENYLRFFCKKLAKIFKKHLQNEKE